MATQNSVSKNIIVTEPATTATLTLADNSSLITSGAFSTTITTTGTTNITLPTSGTLLSSTVSSLTSLTAVGTLVTGIWNATRIGLAYGGTNVDLSATGGTSQVLRQSSSGANITVSQLAASDLSNATTGSGNVVLANTPTLITPVIGTATGTSLTLSSSLFVGQTGSVQWGTGGSVNGFLTMTADGVFRIGDSAGGGSPRVIFGSSSASFVSILRNGTSLNVKLGDNSAFGSLAALDGTFNKTTNQLILGTTNTVTVSSIAPSASRTYTLPDFGANAYIPLSTTGNNLFFTTTGATSVTLPTSGTLVNSAVTTLSSLTSVGTIGTGTWNATAIGFAYGGTGLTSTPANGQLAIGNGSGYTLATLTGTSNQITVTNGAGSITLSTPQSINTSSSPTFTNMGLSGFLAVGNGTPPSSGAQLQVSGLSASSGTNLRGIEVSSSATHTTGAMTASYGILINAPTKPNAGTITTSYGLYVSKPTVGVSNWTGWFEGDLVINNGNLYKINTNGSFQMRDLGSSVECIIRPNGGSKGYLSFTEGGVADRWVLGIEPADDSFYFNVGSAVSNSPVARLDSSGIFYPQAVYPLGGGYYTTGGNPGGTETVDILSITNMQFENGLYIGSFNCFSGDTLITMADGSFRQMKDIAWGEYVLSYDCIEKIFSPSLIETVMIGGASSYVVINEEVETTPMEHLFVNNEWTYAKNIEIGDEILHFEGKKIVEKIELKEFKKENYPTVYDLRLVGASHTYFANGYLAYAANFSEDFPK